MTPDQIACKEWTCSAEAGMEDRLVAVDRIMVVISVMITTMRAAGEDFDERHADEREEYLRVIERHTDEARAILSGGIERAQGAAS